MYRENIISGDVTESRIISNPKKYGRADLNEISQKEEELAYQLVEPILLNAYLQVLKENPEPVKDASSGILNPNKGREGEEYRKRMTARIENLASLLAKKLPNVPVGWARKFVLKQFSSGLLARMKAAFDKND